MRDRGAPLLVGCFLAAFGAYGCGTTSDSNSPSDGGGNDAARDSATDGTADAGGDAALPYGGLISIDVIDNGDAGFTHIVFPGFVAGVYPSAHGDLGCDGFTKKGDCCYVPPAAGGDGGVQKQENAGTITIRNTTANVDLATLPFTEGTGYMNYQWTTPTWKDGDSIQASAPGATIAAFTLSVPAVVAVSGIQPTWDKNTPLSIPLAQDFHVSWKPDPSARFMTLLMAAEQDGTFTPRGAVICEAPDSQGSFTVPSSLFSHFQAGDICSSCGFTRTSLTHAPTSNTDLVLEINFYGGGGATFQ